MDCKFGRRSDTVPDEVQKAIRPTAQLAIHLDTFRAILKFPK